MKIYTRTGDDGTTGLFGGDRVAKSHPRIHAYGTVDETNAAVGLVRSLLPTSGLGPDDAALLDGLLNAIQNDLFVLGGDLASPHTTKYPVPRVEAEHVEPLEAAIDRMDAEIEPLKHFILPGGTAAASALHVARTVARRAERLTIEAGSHEQVSEHAVHYLNRLSDLLFTAARWANAKAGVADVAWVPVERKPKPAMPERPATLPPSRPAVRREGE